MVVRTIHDGDVDVGLREGPGGVETAEPAADHQDLMPVHGTSQPPAAGESPSPFRWVEGTGRVRYTDNPQ